MNVPHSTEETTLPTRLIDQVIGQSKAVEVVRLAAQQQRFVLLIGDPGTGKSLLGRAIAELLPRTPAHSVLSLPNQADPTCPRIRCQTRGEWEQSTSDKLRRHRYESISQNFILGLAASALAIVGCVFVLRDQSYGVGLCCLLALGWLWQNKKNSPIQNHQDLPKVLIDRTEGPAPFIDATACSEGALFGDVRHDPYQSGGAESPSHYLVEPGAVHRAHGGVLFIDEIGSLSPASQKLLLTAIQDKVLPVTGRQSGSSGTLIRSEPIPCDFVLVAAGNAEDLQHISPALRSRIQGFGFEVLTESSMTDTSEHRQDLWRFVAQEVQKDGRIPHFEASAVEAIIQEARWRTGEPGQLTTRLRELGGLIRIAGDLAGKEGSRRVSASHVREALAYATSIEEQQTARQGFTATNGPKPGFPSLTRHNQSGPIRPA